ncbi:MAG: putative iron-sulfur cluster binding protein [Deltaproteobacteria bacterium]|jgi:NAD-dependent dihydropyrimidine dehydrogenase PreA subunit|nr:putative iron-sulfur cluster binding protein [Deltaproteobacteria bacterium]
MGIRRIDYDLCTGCGRCVDLCPMDVMRLDPSVKKPVIKYLRDCMSCFACEEECPENAIYVTPDREKRIPLPW